MVLPMVHYEYSMEVHAKLEYTKDAPNYTSKIHSLLYIYTISVQSILYHPQ